LWLFFVAIVVSVFLVLTAFCCFYVQEFLLRQNLPATDGVFKAALRLRAEAAYKQTYDLFLKAVRNASYLS